MAEIAIASLVEEARGLHPKFSRENIPPVVAHQFVRRAVNYITAQVTQYDEDIATTHHQVTLREFDNALGTAVASADDSYGPDHPDFGSGRVKIPPFTRIINNMRIKHLNRGEQATVRIVPLATQYPPRIYDPTFGQVEVAFPAVAYRGGYLQLTDMRVVGREDHGWQDFEAPMTFHYVPYHDPMSDEATIDFPEILRAAVILRVAYQWATRLELLDYLRAVTGQLTDEVTQVIAQAGSLNQAGQVTGSGGVYFQG